MKIRYMLLHAYGMGGTIRTVVNQANAMAAAGHDVEIVSVVRRRNEPQFAIDPLVRLSALVDQREGITADSLARKVWRRARGKIVPYGEFAAEYFTERVEAAVIDYVSGLRDGILVTTRPALNLIAARRASSSVIRVAQEHMNLASYHERVREQIARHYGRFDAVAVLTETSRREYRKLLKDTPVVRIPNAVHMDERKHSDQSNKIVIAVGRLVPQKGFDMLIPAFAATAEEHPEWKLRIFGTGPSKERLQKRIDEVGAGGRIKLMGRSNRIHEELAKASVYALSSRIEGLPMAMIEAMGHALPIVAFDCPTGPADVLTPGKDGLLVPPRNVPALTEALSRVMGDRELRLRLGATAAETAFGYTPHVVMPLWEKLFTALSNGEPIDTDVRAAR
ncbi:glycosyltransferase family 4 protein [Nonomuraea gerenzanensis]|uniref:Dolichol-phosphate mannosyltransferase in lipid-linked oligosaccharide synthesis cluster n=1 Tax=Nonomuraea gerenzanensis TaxID=93944 RepID=A0A1M4EI26_9ACTN|nr:glycosyltransferase family 4 protein [Nonomuraea gerenzanensis]UBU10229.1 glycosyltransferase family 4 protein [Nonomuraea gerenzanensis]SBO98607.1 Dolichol-phosphate mannosyltransferase in lipid-linked oligosaccharide synthesis cluster [Nonomuraea gerenzanensis]